MGALTGALSGYRIDRCDESTASALLAPAAPSPVLTDTGTSALLALIAPSPVLTDTGTSALLAPAALSPVLAGHTSLR